MTTWCGIEENPMRAGLVREASDGPAQDGRPGGHPRTRASAPPVHLDKSATFVSRTLLPIPLYSHTVGVIEVPKF
jgi:hypothetical protein